MSDIFLPPLLAELAEVAGLARTLAFARDFGGRRIKILARMGDDHPIVLSLGRAGADRLAELRVGEQVVIPYRPLLAELEEVAGLGRTLAFARDFGGQRIKVPARMGDDHPVVLSLGRAGAERLAELRSGEHVVIPYGPTGTTAEARARLARALVDGGSINEAARASGLHHRTAQRMRRKIKDGSQGSLF